MAQLKPWNNRLYMIVGLVAAFALFTFWMRMLPAATIATPTGVNLLGNDPWYNLRLVEQVVASSGKYAWFDAMTLFPHGDTIYWGPLFIYIISALSVLAGATARPEMMYVASCVPPLMAAAMVPIVYLLGSKIADWKTGLLAAGLITVVAGNYVYRSLFGFVDHHIAEVLFSTLFALVYVIALASARSRSIDLRRFETIKIPGAMAVLAGFAYLLGLFTMPTMVLFALIVTVFTLVQFVWDFYRNRSSQYLVLLNLAVFGVAAAGLLVFGLPHPGLSLSQYTAGHIIVYLGVIAGTFVLYGLSVCLKDRPKHYYPLSIAGVALVGVVALLALAPAVYDLLVSSFFMFFASRAVTMTVSEAKPWSLDSAWNTFQLGLLLMAGGAATLIYRNRKDEDPAQIFVLVWSAVIVLSTISHVRYEYYMAVNVALLSAVFVGFVLNLGWNDVRLLVGTRLHRSDTAVSAGDVAPESPKKSKKGQRTQKQHKAKAVARNQPNYLKVGAFAVVALVALTFAGLSLQSDYGMVALAQYSGMNSQWKESLEWMGAHTPDTGVDYLAIYDRDTFQYPQEAYGVMSWWDYGHWITFVAKRIPNANPFQHGVAGPTGSAAFFMTSSEEEACEILDVLGTRYVITDIEMVTGKFWAMATWADPDVGVSAYEQRFLYSTGANAYNVLTLYNQRYYQTMISRLHNFDGSMTDPSTVWYIEYRDAAAARTSVPVMTRVEQMNATAAAAAAAQYNATAPAGSHATTLTSTIYTPSARVPALQHFRLVHESPQNVFTNAGAGGPDIKYVKIFEYVPGAHIRGEGVIEVPVVTNTGREFTYRQESVNGEFVVPYATDGGSGEVKATGPYRIAGTDLTFDVTEDDILHGRYIN